MRNYLFTIMLILAGGILISCKQDSEIKPLLATDAPEEIVYNADGTGGQTVITVSTNQEEWDFTLSPEDGNSWLAAEKGENTITMKVSENDELKNRDEVQMTISAGIAAPVRIRFTQLAAGLRFNLLPDMKTVVFEPNGSLVIDGQAKESADFTVDTNLEEWNVVLQPEDGNGWLEVSARDAAGFSLMAQPVDDMDERASVKVIVTAGDIKKEIEASQKKASIMNLEGLSDGNMTITFTDGSKFDVKVKDGKAVYGVNEAPRVIYSIKHELAEKEIYIGRKDNEEITLKFDADTLTFREAVNGMIPLGAYSEMQMIRYSDEYRTWSYIQEVDLDFLGADELEGAGLEKVNWKPIGVNQDYKFSGTFDGNGKKIYNFYCSYPMEDWNSQSMSLLGHCCDAIIKNVTIMSGYIKGSSGIAAIAGKSEGGYIYNCYNAATIVGNASTAGIVGNFSASMTEGIENNNTIEKCTNDGPVKFSENEADRKTGTMIGGLVGYFSGSGESVLKDSRNNADIDGGNQTGGLVGLGQGDIINCNNEGNVKGLQSIGGIAGRYSCTRANLNIEIKGSSNSGAVSGNDKIGGLAGELFTGLITNSVNTGKVSATGDRVGGIVGTSSYFMQQAVYTNTYNTADVEGNDFVGGLIGEVRKAILNGCYNTGKVSGTGENTGTIAGKVEKKRDSSTEPDPNSINECFWLKYGSETAVGLDENNITDTRAFSATEWPSSDMKFWKTGDGESGAFWKSLGEWKGGGTPDGINSIFPKLHWEK